MPRSKETWTSQEDEILLNSIKITSRKNWKKISSLLNNKTPLTCFYRYRKINPEISKSKFSKEEDNQLKSLHEKYGNNWSLLSRIIKNRGPKQIRDRIINNLDPKIQRGNFTHNDDLKILELRNLYGNKWSKISKHFENRSSDIIKTRYYSSVRNKVELLNFLKSLEKKEYSDKLNVKEIEEKEKEIEEKKKILEEKSSIFSDSYAFEEDKDNLFDDECNFEKSIFFDFMKNPYPEEKFVMQRMEKNEEDNECIFKNNLRYFFD